MLRCSGRRRPRVEGENHARFALFPEPALECRPRVLEVHGADGERDGPCREVLARRRRRRWKRWKRRRRRSGQPLERRRRRNRRRSRGRRLFFFAAPVGAVRDDKRFVRVPARVT